MHSANYQNPVKPEELPIKCSWFVVRLEEKEQNQIVEKSRRPITCSHLLRCLAWKEQQGFWKKNSIYTLLWRILLLFHSWVHLSVPKTKEDHDLVWGILCSFSLPARASILGRWSTLLASSFCLLVGLLRFFCTIGSVTYLICKWARFCAKACVLAAFLFHFPHFVHLYSCFNKTWGNISIDFHSKKKNTPLYVMWASTK